MKPIRMTMLLGCLAMTLAATAQTSDTLVIDNPTKVIIAQTADTLSVQVAGSQQNPDYRYSREVVLSDKDEVHTTATQSHQSALGWDFSLIESETNNGRLDGHLGTFLGAGLRFPLNKPAGMTDLSFWSSLEIDINMIRFDLSFGHSKYWYTLDWNIGITQMMMKGNNRYIADRDGNASIGGYPTGTKPDCSSMLWLDSRLALDVHRMLSKSSSLALGIEWQNRGDKAFCRSKYQDVDGKTTRQTDEMTGLRAHHFSFKAEYTFMYGLSFFVKYSPWSDFHKGCGPDYSPLSIGFRIF